MLLPPTIAAWLHGFVASLLALVLIAGGAGGAALADLAHCGASEAACDCDWTEDGADADAHEEAHVDAGDGCCNDGSATPCTPGCDDCGCCPGAMSALPPAAAFVLGEQPGAVLEQPVSRPVQGARGASMRIDRPPRAPLC